MLFPILPLLLFQQHGPQAQAPPPSPIAKVVVTPAQPSLPVGDSLQLRGEAVDASGRRVPGAVVRFVPAGGWFEGSVDSTGLVHAGAVGILPVTAVGIVPGARPVVERLEVRMVPGPAARVTISARVTRLVVGQRVRLSARSYSALGDPRDDRITWRSSAPARLRLTSDGVATALASGSVTAIATAGAASDELAIEVLGGPVAAIEVTPGSAQARQGDVLRFKLTAKDATGRAINGLTASWSISPGHGHIEQDGTFVGYEPGVYIVTATLGTRSAEAVVALTHRDVRRPVRVVGRLPRMQFTTEEVWVHPNGRVAYLGTGSGGDRMYAIDITNPASPVVTDSIVTDTRRVNDIMTTPDGRFLVFTREGASDRKNGVVFASLEDPLHPRPIGAFTEGLTAGVHSSFIYRDPRHGTHAYLTNDGTSELHVVNIDDPHAPREVARWRPRDMLMPGSLHDIDVQNGLLYASWWNEGLVILDVGNGIKGGTPSSPRFVSQFKYDLNELYRGVEASGGPGFIRGTHTAWRHKDYVFISDEVFPGRGVAGAKDAAAGRAYGRMQVIDVSDIEKPRSVAWYEPEYGGVHNVWVAGDTLYMGTYNGGFRAFDVSGELRGDLRAQGREIAHLQTADMQGFVKNTAMTWGVVVNPRDGLAYVNDMYNGLWIVRIEPRQPFTP